MGYSKIKYVLATLLLVISLYLFYNDFFIPSWIYNIFWFIFVLDILRVIIPKFAKHSPFGKFAKKFYKESDYNKDELLNYKQTMQIRSLITFTSYIIFLLGIGVLYYLNIINKSHIILIVIFLNFLDYFCINTWCIFHKIFIRNRCCNTCRIYNWDHFMKFAPFIFIADFRTWSLFILGLIALIEWEIYFYFYPERFTDISNENLRCSNCELSCRFKK